MIRPRTRYVQFSVALTAGLLLTVGQFSRVAHAADDSLDFSKDEPTLDFNKDSGSDDAQLEKELNDDNAKVAPPTKPQAPSRPEGKTTAAKPSNDSGDDFDLDAEAKKMGDEKPSDTPIDDKSFDVEPLDGAGAAVQAPAAPVAPVAPTENIETSFSDEPNMNYESKLHDIFENFYSKKIPDEEWKSLVGQKSAEKYQIQKGDNLWNVSKTIFGDGQYWPKVWSLNTNIKNPHMISPNNSIQFLLGDESQPPAFAVTENATNTNVNVNVAKNETGVSQETNVNTTGTPTDTPTVNPDGKTGEDAEPEIPPPLYVSRPVVKHLPPSLPEWQDQSARYGYDSAGINFVKRKILEVKDQTPLVSYISEQAPNDLGTVKEIETGHDIASSYQYIYVSMKHGHGEIGQTYLAVANRGEIQSVHSSITGFLGYAIDVQGEVQLVERVDGRDEESGEMYRALVLNIVNPVAVGSQLIEGKIENVQVTENGERSQVVAQIIGGSFFNRRQVYGNESIAYINRGEDAGLKFGQILPIRANRIVRNPDTEVKGNVRPIGWMRVIKTTPHFATCLIIRVWSDVLTGDLTGSGTYVDKSIGQSDIDQDVGVPAKSLNEELDEKDDFDSAPTTEPSKDGSDLQLDE